MSFICISCACTGVAMSFPTEEINGKQNLSALDPNVKLKPTRSNENRVERIDRTLFLDRSVEGPRVSDNLQQDQTGLSPATGTDKRMFAIVCKQDSDGQKYFQQTRGCLEKEYSRPPDSMSRSSMHSGRHEYIYVHKYVRYLSQVTCVILRMCCIGDLRNRARQDAIF